ncbi:MAG: RNA polymerase Rpb4 family protein [Aigarchaeota archaeon]|nr:RNA polymerase Rpb4 family protein [Aigarchaeota archaeon]MCX8192576.1 RNA polymerase Rpb4 family protein [Nitrososphaeria archaeon]MDW7985688.1 RNA polymerase Rpb4 family protein [Nitrososphaerota archaeon]
MVKKIISQKPLSLPEVKEILEERREKLDSIQLRVLEYTRKYSKLSSEKANELIEELVSRFELTREEAVQIVDICPTHVEELRAILSGYKRLVSFLLFSEDKLHAIVDTVKKYLEEDVRE